MQTYWLERYRSRRLSVPTVLDKMIVRDLLATLLSVWMVLVLIIVSRKFIRILDLAVDGQIANETLLTLLGLKTVAAAVSFLPAALFMSVLMVLGRMYRDQEMAAIASAGGGTGLIYRSVFLLVAPLALIALGLSLYVAPWAAAQTEKIIRKDSESSDIRGIAAGRFSEYGLGDLVFYVESISAGKIMHNVFVQNRQQDSSVVINADSARIRELPEGRYVVFSHGRRTQGQPGRLDYVLEEFTDYAVRLEDKITAETYPEEALTTRQLWQSGRLKEVAELQRRLSMPLAVLLLTFLAVPLAQISPRSGLYGNMLTGFLIYFCYGNFSGVSQNGVATGKIPFWLGLTAVSAALLLIGLALLARLYGGRWLMIKLKEKLPR